MRPIIEADVASSSRSSAASGAAASARLKDSYASCHARCAYNSRARSSSSTPRFTPESSHAPVANVDDCRNVAQVTLNITMTLDGFVAGPNQTVEEPLGAGGERIHEWLYGLASFKEHHGDDSEARGTPTTTCCGNRSPPPARW